MDELNANFSQLSTTAAEWTPGGSKAVKEFVPGQKWETPAPPVQEEQMPSTVPVTPALSDDELWRYHRDLSLERSRQMAPDDERHKAVPLPYCNAFCLDDSKSSFGYPSLVFQVTSREDGQLYCLRRFDNVRSVSHRIAQAVADRWSKIRHPIVIPLERIFLSQRAVFFVHEYVPGARPLAERLPERWIWSGLVQVVGALRAIHRQGLAARTLDRHLLTTLDATGLRFRLNCGGVIDTLEFERRVPMEVLQQGDVQALGRLILSWASGIMLTPQSEPGQMAEAERILHHMSPDLHKLALALLRPRPPSLAEVSQVIAVRALDEQEHLYAAMDRTERALATEYDSGRMLRILLKMGMVNERPELGPNRQWAESGDCYVLSLFRDFVFHQADGGGFPVMDMGHVMTALNKLDAGDEEKICLASRDGKSLMVVTYADVARCLENAFHELNTSAVPSTTLQY